MGKPENYTYYPSLEEIHETHSKKLVSPTKVGSRWSLRLVAVILFFSLIAIGVALVVVPWVQTVPGKGKVIAYSPNYRIQSLSSPVDGRIERWYVLEGAAVKKGDKIVDVIDIDPDILSRLEREREAAVVKLEAMQQATATSKKNIDRQRDLLKQGLSSQRAFELSELEYAKFLSDLSSAAAELAKIETRLARQASQSVNAPVDGVIQRITAPEGGPIVKAGQELAVIVPNAMDRAVELWVRGMDVPLLTIGRKVRLQFEGWPAVQFSGWPSVAVGTFGGQIAVIDPSDDGLGNFRILVVPDRDSQEWPDTMYLRQGVRTVGWVLLDSVRLGWELWRQFNGFPPSLKSVGSVPSKGGMASVASNKAEAKGDK